VDLLGGVELDVGAFGHGQALDVGHRVVRQLPDLARALEDAVEQNDHLLQAAPRQLALAQMRGEPAFDHVRVDPLQRFFSERGQQMERNPLFIGLFDAPGWIRTSDLRIRSPLLYPAELRGLAGRRAARPQGRAAGGRPQSSHAHGRAGLLIVARAGAP
jgi:hypothetical protein